MTTTRYKVMQRLVHWAVALSVIAALAIGFTLGILGFDRTMATFGEAGTNLLYKAHKTLGVLILGLMLCRLGLRIAYGRPPHAPDFAIWKRVTAETVHMSLYALLILQPVVGWLATAAGGYPVEFFNWTLPPLVGKDTEVSEWLYGIHATLGIAIAVLATIHVCAALTHWRVWRDGVMSRMSLP